MSDPDNVRVEWEPIEISTTGTVTASELAPLLDEIHQLHKFVRVSIPAPGNEPPAADLTEFVITYALPAALYLGSKYVDAFFSEWGGAHGKAVREASTKVSAKGRFSRNPDSQRKFIPCQFSVGRARFIIGEPIDEDEFAEALLQIPGYYEKLQAQGFDFASPGYPYRIWWNSETQSWHPDENSMAFA